MNNITDHDWEYSGIDDSFKNDWYLIPLTIIGATIAFAAFAGVENVFNVMVRFVTSL